MKRILFVLLLFVVACAKGQTNVYHPFPDSNAVWNDYLSTCMGLYDERNEREYFLNGDTLLNGNIYNKLYLNGIYMEADGCWGAGHVYYTLGPFFNDRAGAIREDSTKHIYYYSFDTLLEELLYDFSLQVGDYFPLSHLHTDTTQKIFISSIDSIFDGVNYRKRYMLSDSIFNNVFPNYCSIIEGIGSSRGLLSTIDINTFEPPLLLLRCFRQNGSVKYSDSTFSCLACSPNCSYLSTDNIINRFSFSMSPNPFYTTATLEIKNEELRMKNLEMKICNTMGMLVRTIALEKSRGEAIITRGELSDGLYFYQLVSEDGETVAGKFVVE